MREAGTAWNVEFARRGRQESRRGGSTPSSIAPAAWRHGANGKSGGEQMLDDGLIAVDPLGIALDVDERDRAGDGVWALGPMTKGRYWEIIAVPDIRGQRSVSPRYRDGI
jgi:hypothetical protein